MNTPKNIESETYDILITDTQIVDGHIKLRWSVDGSEGARIEVRALEPQPQRLFKEPEA